MYFKFYNYIFFSVLILGIHTNVSAQKKAKSAVIASSSLSQDLNEMMLLFEGEFDNFGQAYKEKGLI